MTEVKGAAGIGCKTHNNAVIADVLESTEFAHLLLLLFLRVQKFGCKLLKSCNPLLGAQSLDFLQDFGKNRRHLLCLRAKLRVFAHQHSENRARFGNVVVCNGVAQCMNQKKLSWINRHKILSINPQLYLKKFRSFW